MKDLLRIEHLSKHYDGFDLSDVNLSVPAGSVVGFIGSNGAGKTTTIKAALDLIKIDTGKIDLLGVATNDVSPSAKAQARQRIGVVFDACPFPANIRVHDAGTIMKSAYQKWDADSFDRYLKQFGLDLTKKVKDLSRGMGMKLSLACALSHNADLLILDEATAGLDPLARDETLEILRDFMSGGTRSIFMSSHITSDLEKIADYIVCIDKGRIVFSIEKDAITDLAGIAQCRAAEFDDLRESGFFEPGEMHYAKHAYGVSVLVPDRFAFAESFPAIALDKMSIDDYMTLMLKGERA